MRVGRTELVVSPWFFASLALLGAMAGAPWKVGAFVALGAAAVLLHEGGHAAAIWWCGLVPRIHLVAFGGRTEFENDEAVESLTRGQRFVIFAAGPAISVIVGISALFFIAASGPLKPVAAYLWGTWLEVNLGWGLLNLTPVLPLDGGRMLESLLPKRMHNTRNGFLASFAFGCSAALALVLLGLYRMAIPLGIFTLSSLGMALRLVKKTPPAAAPDGLRKTVQDAREQLKAGKPERALVMCEVVRSNCADPQLRAESTEILILAQLGLGRYVAAQTTINAAATELQPEVLVRLRRALQSIYDTVDGP